MYSLLMLRLHLLQYLVNLEKISDMIAGNGTFSTQSSHSQVKKFVVPLHTWAITVPDTWIHDWRGREGRDCKEFPYWPLQSLNVLVQRTLTVNFACVCNVIQNLHTEKRVRKRRQNNSSASHHVLLWKNRKCSNSAACVIQRRKTMRRIQSVVSPNFVLASCRRKLRLVTALSLLSPHFNNTALPHWMLNPKRLLTGFVTQCLHYRDHTPQLRHGSSDLFS